MDFGKHKVPKCWRVNGNEKPGRIKGHRVPHNGAKTHRRQ